MSSQVKPVKLVDPVEIDAVTLQNRTECIFMRDGEVLLVVGKVSVDMKSGPGYEEVLIFTDEGGVRRERRRSDVNAIAVRPD